jgi:superkiller protein 3
VNKANVLIAQDNLVEASKLLAKAQKVTSNAYIYNALGIIAQKQKKS